MHGFEYFDDRDLIGFVDGTENPTGQAAIDAALDRRRGRGVRRRQLRDRAEIPARSRRLERAAHRSPGAHHRPHQAVRHRARRRRQADVRPQRADHDRGGRQGGQDPARQHAVRPCRRSASSGPTSSATPARRARSSRCWRTCSSAGRPAITIGCWTSAGPITGNLFFAPSATFLESVEGDEPTAVAPDSRTAMPIDAPTPPAARCATARSASAPSKEIRLMNNLHRELAPISEAAWAEIEEEAIAHAQALSRRAARRGRAGTGRRRPLGRRHRPSAQHRSARERDPRAPARGEGAGRTARPVRSRSPGRSTTSSAARRFGLAAREGRRAASWPLPRIARSSMATPPPASKASARAPAIRG